MNTRPLPDPASEAVFRPVQACNALDATVDRLLHAIRLGIVPAGSRFPSERDLASRLEVSRITLREAIRLLQEQGCVESRRGRHGGTFVSDVPPRPTPGQALGRLTDTGTPLEELLAFRRGLETGTVVRLAETGLDGAQDGLLADRLAVLDHASPDDYRRWDTVFHIALAQLAGSRELAAVVADVRLRVNGLMDAAPLLEDGVARSNSQHREIVRAVRSRDPEAARRALGDHLAEVERRIRTLLG